MSKQNWGLLKLIIILCCSFLFGEILLGYPSFATEIPGKDYALFGVGKIMDGPPPMENLVFEDCGEAYFIFERLDATDRIAPLTINFSVSAASTASASDYSALPASVTIPAGEASALIALTILADNIEEDLERLIIEPEAGCSCKMPYKELLISDVEPLLVTLENKTTCSNKLITLKPAINGGLPEYSYKWSTGSVSPSIQLSPSQNTSVSVSVTDACGKVAIAEGLIEVTDLPRASIAGPGTLCTGNSTANIPVSLTGTGPWSLTYKYNGTLQPPVNNITASNFNLPVSQEGSYQLVSVTGANGCEGTASGTYQVEFINFTASAQNTAVSCFGLPDGQIDLTVTGGAIPYRFNWSGGLGNAADHSNVPAGNYTVTITDAAGCTLTANAPVGSPARLEISSIRLRGMNCDLGSSIIDLTVGGGTVPYSYQWSHVPDNIEDPGNVTVGNFSVEVTDDHGCSTTGQLTVDPPSPVQSSVAAIIPANCANPSGGKIDLEVSGGATPYQYIWDNGLPNVQDPGGLAVGTYRVRVVDAIGCETTDSAAVGGDFIAPVADAGPDANLTCPSAGLPLNGGGSSTGANYSYQWSSQDGQISVGGQSRFPVVHDPGIYTVVVTNNSNGCTAQDQTEVILAPNTPYVNVGQPDTLNCYQPAINLPGQNSSSSPGFQEEWDTDTGNFTNGNTGLSPEIDKGGKYFLTITNPSNNCYDTDSIVVRQDTLKPVAIGGNNGLLDCKISEITLGGEGSSSGDDFTYEWTTTDGNILSPANSDTILADAEGIYIFTVTNTTNGCTATDKVLVIDNAPSDILVSVKPPLCAGDQGGLDILDVVNGRGTFFFSINGATFTSSTAYNHLDPGSYSIVAINNDGCSVTKEIVIPETEPLILKLEKEVRLRFGEEHTFNTSVNVPPNKLELVRWDPPEFLSCTDCLTPSVIPTASQDYALTIKSLNGCEITGKVRLIVAKEYDVYFSNAFSPYDANGVNDIFFIQSRGDIIANIHSFRIYNRWGTLMHEALDFLPNDPQTGWDGYFKGRKQRPGVFIYIADIEFIDGERVLFKGDLTLLE